MSCCRRRNGATKSAAVPTPSTTCLPCLNDDPMRAQAIEVGSGDAALDAQTEPRTGRTIPWYWISQAGIVGLSAALTAAWIAVDRTPPAWDQARYLLDSLQYVHGLQQDGPAGVVNAFFSADRYYAPGYIAFVFPFLLVLGPSVQSALIANLVLWVVLLLAVGGIARQMFGNAAGLMAVALTATR